MQIVRMTDRDHRRKTWSSFATCEEFRSIVSVVSCEPHSSLVPVHLWNAAHWPTSLSKHCNTQTHTGRYMTTNTEIFADRLIQIQRQVFQIYLFNRTWADRHSTDRQTDRQTNTDQHYR